MNYKMVFICSIIVFTVFLCAFVHYEQKHQRKMELQKIMMEAERDLVSFKHK